MFGSTVFVQSTVHGSATLVVECEGLLFWNVSVPAASGSFQNGKTLATATATVHSSDPILQPASHTQDIRLVTSGDVVDVGTFTMTEEVPFIIY